MSVSTQRRSRQQHKQPVTRSRVIARGGARRRHRVGGSVDQYDPSLADDDYSGTGYLQRFEPPPPKHDEGTSKSSSEQQPQTTALDAQWSAMERREAAKPPSPPWSFNMDTQQFDTYFATLSAAVSSVKDLPRFLVYILFYRINAASAALLLVTLVVFAILILFQ